MSRPSRSATPQPSADMALLERYVKMILAAPVYDLAIRTPLQAAPALSERLGNQILLKREDLQPCLLYTSPSPRDRQKSRMPSSA